MSYLIIWAYSRLVARRYRSTNTYYVKLVGYAGANSSALYALRIAKP